MSPSKDLVSFSCEYPEINYGNENINVVLRWHKEQPKVGFWKVDTSFCSFLNGL